MRLNKYIVLAFVILTASSLLHAKQNTQMSSSIPAGKLMGLIFDAGEARVPAAKILIENECFRREVASAADGSYEVDLPEGKYKIRVERVGFYPFRQKGILIQANVTTKLDITLKVGKRHDERHP